MLLNYAKNLTKTKSHSQRSSAHHFTFFSSQRCPYFQTEKWRLQLKASPEAAPAYLLPSGSSQSTEFPESLGRASSGCPSFQSKGHPPAPHFHPLIQRTREVFAWGPYRACLCLCRAPTMPAFQDHKACTRLGRALPWLILGPPEESSYFLLPRL